MAAWQPSPAWVLYLFSRAIASTASRFATVPFVRFGPTSTACADSRKSLCSTLSTFAFFLSPKVALANLINGVWWKLNVLTQCAKGYRPRLTVPPSTHIFPGWRLSFIVPDWGTSLGAMTSYTKLGGLVKWAHIDCTC